MHGSGGQTCKQSRHMWPVPHSPVATVASNGCHVPNFFSKDGRKIRVGDCALFKSPQDSPPFIGIIRWLSLGKEDSISLGVNWLYRPADIRLTKGTLLEAAPNEVFYSFHKDEIPAASLLHPCKVAFLRKGVELPSGVSSFVCRQVYDIENRCLWWLTDKDYINEQQEEVDKLLDKTRLEMHGGVQPGGRSPRPLNGPSLAQLKSGSDSVQNSTSSSLQVKGKKRERGQQGFDSAKREPLPKAEDGESGQFGLENVLKSEIAKITEKGGLVDFKGVERLVQIMQPDSADKKIDLAGRIVLVDVVAVTDRLDCLAQFVELGGLSVLDDWLQEVHKGKIGDSSSSKETDKSVDEFLMSLLRALDKLPVNLRALQKCNVGRSVNQLRTHKNYEIQKKVKSLVDTWKKRVGAEMNMNDAKTGSGRVVSWSNNNKPSSSEVSQVGSRKTGSSTEVGLKNLVQHAASKTVQVRHVTGEVSKTSSLEATKPLASSAGMPSKDQNSRTLVVAGGSDIPLSSIKEERSSSSSQSQNNSQSSDHVKTMGSSCREDAKSSTAGSPRVNKISSTASRHGKSGNGAHGSAISGVQKETLSGRLSNPGKSHHSENLSAARVSHVSPIELPLPDQGNNHLIVRLPSTGRSPARGASVGSLDDQGAVDGRASPPGEKHDNHEKNLKGVSEAFRPSVNSDSCQVRMTHFEDGEVPSGSGEWHQPNEDVERSVDVSIAAGALPKIASKSGKSYEASLCSINALIESCVKFSEANASVSPGDDIGMNLLASVAAGEISKSNNVSPSGSPCMDSPVPEVSFSGEDGKLKQVGEEVVLTQAPSHVDCDSSAATLEQRNAGDFIQSKAEPRHHVSHSPTINSRDTKGTCAMVNERVGEHSTQMNCSSGSRQNIDAPPLVSDMKFGDPCDASIGFLCSGKESFSEVEGMKQDDEQRKSGSSWAKSNKISDSELKTESPLPDNVKIEDYADKRTKEDCTPVVAEAADGSAEVDMDSEKPMCSTFDVGAESQNYKEESSYDIVKEQMSSHVSKGDYLVERKIDGVLLSASGNSTELVFMGEKADDYKAEGTERISEQKGDICPASEHDDETHLERKLNDSVVCSVPASDDGSPSIPLAGKEMHDDSSQQKSLGEMVEEQGSSSVSASGADATAKLDFDLNEGFPVDDGNNTEIPKVGDTGTSAVHLHCPLPFQISSISSSFPMSITVAAPAKGPFVLPDNPLRIKGELGWRGSAATSAFRPAEPRKNLEVPPTPSTSEPIFDTSTSKTGRTMDFDLNVPDERAYEDIASQCAIQDFSSESRSHDRGAGGLDLDLNRVDESPDAWPFSGSNNSRMEIPLLSGRSSLSSGLSNGGINASRDFDLNNGPGLDDLAPETVPHTQPLKGSLPLSAPFSGIRVSTAEFGNFSPWFPGNSYSAITIPSIFPSRTDQSYVAPAGSQRVLCPGSTLFGSEMYRGPVLSSSPAVAFPPTPSFQYPGFPFETSFPLSSHTFPGCSTSYMDSSSGGTLCFSTIPSQLVGPAGVLSSSFHRPYVMNIPGAASNVVPDVSKWTSQGLDLNTGPGNTDTDRRDERLPSGLRHLSIPTSQALAEEQLKMFQVGGVLKRKEPDGGLDPMDRISYKQHSWQ